LREAGSVLRAFVFFAWAQAGQKAQRPPDYEPAGDAFCCSFSFTSA
jgi:hypothetical protein